MEGTTPMRVQRPAVLTAGLRPMMLLPWHGGQSLPRVFKRCLVVSLRHPMFPPRSGGLAGCHTITAVRNNTKGHR